MSTTRLVAAGLLIACAWAPAARATENPPAKHPHEHWFEAGFALGAHLFTKDHGLGRAKDSPLDQSPASGAVFGVRLGLHLSPYAVLEVEGLATGTHARDGSADMWIFHYAGQVAVYPFGRATVQPFLLVGFGSIASVTADPSVIPDDQDGMARAGLGLQLNLGERIGLGKRVGLRVESRILTPLAFAAGLVPVGDEIGYGGPDFQALASLTVNFGKVERQIIVRETVVVKENLDPDDDGIASDADKCPKIAEDRDGFEDDDGCPDHDNDSDGIPDAQDKCPNKPENKDGFEDDDGCPEEDPDGDGLLGDADKCPTEPETKNGYKDGDGCPDEMPPDVKRFSGVIQGINFKTRSAVLLPSSLSILDRAVKVLRDHPEIQVEISGHTDGRGKADSNRSLSRRRAESVRSHLIKKGIKPARLTAVGHGEDNPISTNKTAAGRASNRRTEFRITWETPDVVR